MKLKYRGTHGITALCNRAITPDYSLAFAAAWDHGNRHAHAHGRTVWTEDDYDAACAELERLLKLMEVD